MSGVGDSPQGRGWGGWWGLHLLCWGTWGAGGAAAQLRSFTRYPTAHRPSLRKAPNSPALGVCSGSASRKNAPELELAQLSSGTAVRTELGTGWAGSGPSGWAQSGFLAGAVSVRCALFLGSLG